MNEAPEPKRAYQLNEVQQAAKITIERVLSDVSLRKWCVEQSIADQSNAGMSPSEIYEFVTQSSVEFLEGLGYVVKSPDESPPSLSGGTPN
jgi:hypothetical protein